MPNAYLLKFEGSVSRMTRAGGRDGGRGVRLGAEEIGPALLPRSPAAEAALASVGSAGTRHRDGLPRGTRLHGECGAVRPTAERPCRHAPSSDHAGCGGDLAGRRRFADRPADPARPHDLSPVLRHRGRRRFARRHDSGGVGGVPAGPAKPAALFGGVPVSFHSVDQLGLIELIHGEPRAGAAA